LLGIEELAMALKLATVAPEGTVTEVGTVSNALLLLSVTLVPREGAVWLRVTVQVLIAPWPRLAGLQATAETRPGADRPTVTVWELAPSVAVTIAL
jgi:hypothetical protein